MEAITKELTVLDQCSHKSQNSAHMKQNDIDKKIQQLTSESSILK